MGTAAMALEAAAEARSFAADDSLDAGSARAAAEPQSASALRDDNYDTVLSLLKESDESRKAERLRTEETETLDQRVQDEWLKWFQKVSDRRARGSALTLTRATSSRARQRRAHADARNLFARAATARSR